MVVSELIAELNKLPQDAWVDAMFPNDSNAYAVVGADSFDINGGTTIAVIDIVNDTPLVAV